MDLEKLKPFLPTLYLLLAAWFFKAFPGLTVTLVSGSLFVLGILYAYVVYKVQSAKRSSFQYSDFQGEPNFKNVTIHIRRRMHF